MRSLLALAASLCLSSACTPPPPAPREPATPVLAQKPLERTDVVLGTGAEAKPGAAVSVHYVGTLPDGTKFDSSRDRGEPFTFIIGQGKVIRGWELGVAGMKVGGTRKLVIPPHLGYGEAGSPPRIPGQATLLFEIELLHVVE